MKIHENVTDTSHDRYLQVGWEGSAAERSASTFRLFERSCRAKSKRGQSFWDTLKFQHELMERITVRSLLISENFMRVLICANR